MGSKKEDHVSLTFWKLWRAGLKHWTMGMVYYRKAFDSVPHQRLLEKLKEFGIKGKLRAWLEDFLMSRTMTVGVRGAFSQLQAVLSGVPQGSVIGPLLFLLFVNELPNWIKNELRMFADDTKIWCPIKTAADSITFCSRLLVRKMAA